MCQKIVIHVIFAQKLILLGWFRAEWCAGKTTLEVFYMHQIWFIGVIHRRMLCTHGHLGLNIAIVTTVGASDAPLCPPDINKRGKSHCSYDRSRKGCVVVRCWAFRWIIRGLIGSELLLRYYNWLAACEQLTFLWTTCEQLTFLWKTLWTTHLITFINAKTWRRRLGYQTYLQFWASEWRC